MTDHQAAVVLDQLILLLAKDEIKFADPGAKAVVLSALAMGKSSLLAKPAPPPVMPIEKEATTVVDQPQG